MSSHTDRASAATLVDLLRWRARHQPDQLAYAFLVDGEAEAASLTYAALDRHARRIAAALQRLVTPGERALLLYPPGLEYVAAFFGCLYAGAVAVPAYPPQPDRLERTLPRLRAILQDARPQVALTMGALLPLGQALLADDPAVPPLSWLASDAVDGASAAQWAELAPEPTALAFLQYTSGSTGVPRGVMLSHDNLMHNSSAIQRCFEHTPASRGLIWLPPYHDMGLIGGILQPLYAGFPVTLMSPVDFLQRPLRWLQAITTTRATTSGGPNFAYDLCVRKITPEQRALLDLRSWEVAFTGAEPIRPETLDRFAATFASCGFRREAFYPCYGLAEATLIVSGGAKSAQPILLPVERAALEQHRVVVADEPATPTQTLVGCGQPLPELQVVVANPDARSACPPGAVGEIWVAGPSVAQGYWNRPEDTAQTFQAYLADTGAGPFVRTGDLGFVHEGELFIAGRSKDLIIIRGSNHYPEDIEQTVARSHPALRPVGAAFSADVEGEERLVVVQEVERHAQSLDVEQVSAAVRRAVAEAHELQVYAVVLIRAGSIPKTSSGKIQRHRCRAEFLGGGLDVIGRSILDAPAPTPLDAGLTRELLLAAPPEEQPALLAAYLQAQAARVLRVAPERLDLQQPLITLGVDSLMAVELKQAVEHDLGVDLPVARLLQGPSLAELTTQALAALATPAVAAGPSLTPHTATVEQPLSYEQQSLWFMHRLAPESTTNTLVFATRLSGELDVPALRRAFQALLDRHAALRTTFATQQGRPVQRVHTRVPVCFQADDATAWSEADVRARLAEASHPVDLEAGPLLRVHLFERSPSEHLLLVAVAHIVADLWSLALLIDELGALYSAERTGHPARLAPVPLQYTDYARWEADMLGGPAGLELWAYWQQVLAGNLPVLNLPTDRPRPAVQTYRGTSRTFELSAERTRELKALGEAHGATLYMTLLAAFTLLLNRYTDQDDLLIGTPMAGRGRPELMGVVGPFAKPVALRAQLAATSTFPALLGQMREVVLGAFAHQDYPLARLVEELQPLRDPSRSPLFQVMFNFLNPHLHHANGMAAYAIGIGGAQMEWAGLRMESIALDRGVDQFDLTLMMAELDGRLVGAWQYNSDLFDAARIAEMDRHFQRLLEGLVEQPERPVAALLAPIPRQRLMIAVAATFTAEPLAESLSFWMGELGIAASVRCAPYNQVFQQLLDPLSLIAANDGVNVVLLRLEDLAEIAPGDGDEAERALVQAVGEWLQALASAAQRGSATYLVGLCPLADTLAQDAGLSALFARIEHLIRTHIATSAGVYPLPLAELPRRYRVAEYYDPFTEELGQIPYTPEYFAALGTTIARTIYALRSTPYKVIALDCDQTLWQGICGEDGPNGVTITADHRALQEFLVEQYNAGMLLCLCSKNNPEDVREVFRLHPDMPLRWEHFVARKINWQPKSENLLALARELRLGLDSMIVLDDDPLECAELRSRCPEALTLQLPQRPAELPAFLDHVWAFDHLNVTAEDRRRTLLYAQNLEREQLQAAAPTIDDFLAGLQLQVTFAPAEPRHLPRVAELTQRTNQFNATTIRRTEGELRAQIATGSMECWTVAVSDRFGDYGVVGAVIAERAAPVLTIDTFLLSCRVLGRRVEDVVLDKLRQIAQERNCSTLRLVYRPTPKNAPVLDFLKRVAPELGQPAGDGLIFSFAAETTAPEPQQRRPAAVAPLAGADGADGSDSAAERAPALDGAGALAGAREHCELLSRIALQFQTADQVLRAMRAQKRARPELDVPFVAPRTAVEEVLAAIWAEGLGLDRVGIEDNFFALGGHSLLAIQIVSRLHDVFPFEIPLLTLFFETPTIARLAEAVTQSQSGEEDVEKIAQVFKRLETLSDAEVELLLREEELEGNLYE